MRRILIALCLLLLVACAYAQGPGGSFTNDFFYEGFGDSGTQNCGYGSPWNIGLYAAVGCNYPWVITANVGTDNSVSIGPSPGSKQYPQGPSSLSINTGTASGDLVTVSNFSTPTVPASATTSVTLSLNVASSNLATSNGVSIYGLCNSLSNSCSGGAYHSCWIKLQGYGGNIYLLGEGSTASTQTANITYGADNIVVLTCVPGGTSSISLNGATPLTFTGSNYPWSFQQFGSFYSNNTYGAAYSIGSVKVNVSQPSPGAGPDVYVNFSAGPSAGVLTSTNLPSQVIGGNGAWSSTNCTGTATWMTYATGAHTNLYSPVDALSSMYSGAESTLGYNFLLSGGTSPYCEYQWVTASPVLSTGEWVMTTLPTSDSISYVSMDPMYNNGDFTSFMTHGGHMYLETENNPNGYPVSGSYYSFSPSTWYYRSLQIQAKYLGFAAGADLLLEGAVSSGTFQAGETVTQTTSGATATITGALPTAIGGSPSAQGMEFIAVSGTADATGSWSGNTSGAIFTPSYRIPGAVTSGTLSTTSETLTQTGTGATATLVGNGSAFNLPYGIGVAGSFAIKILNLSGSPNFYRTWTGGTSGAVYTPTVQIVTSYSETTSATTLTVSGTNYFIAGTPVLFSFSVGPTYLNAGGPYLVTSQNSTTFTVAYAGSANSGSATGTAGVLPLSRLPSTFDTLRIYDASCNLVSTQKKLAYGSSATPTASGYAGLGRGGDTNASGITTSWNVSSLFMDYSRGRPIPCH